MSLVDEISAMTVDIECGESVTYQDIYIMLLRSLIEIRQLSNTIKVLKDTK